MKVLWFTHTSSCYHKVGLPAHCYNGCGWISSLEMELKKRDDVVLGVCFYTNWVSELKKEKQDGTTYYLLPRPKKSLKYVIETVIDKPEVSTWKHEMLAMPALISIVDDFKPDVVQVFGSENIYGLIAKYVSVPVVLHIQGILTTCLNTFLPPFVSWRMYMWKDRSLKNILQRVSDRIAWKRNSITEQRMLGVVKYIMGHSSWDKRVTKLFNSDFHYYLCGEVLRPAFYEDSRRVLPSKPVFVTIISSPLYKGYDLVLKTALMLKNIMRDFEWKVFGDINPRFIEHIFKVKHEDVNVRLMGVASAEQLKDALLSATAYVHTSYIENACNSVCESQLLGIPGVATYVGGIPSVIDDGKTGFLVPANDPYQMAFLMKYLAEHVDINIEMGERAKEIAMKRHDRVAIADRVMEVYKDILAKQKSEIRNN